MKFKNKIKKKKLHIVSLFHLNTNIAGKDMFLVPMYLGRHLGASVELVYPRADFNQEFSGEYRGVKLTPIRSKSKYYSTFWSEKEMGWWLVKNARRIDVLFLFWLNPRNIIFARIYKFLNPKGVCYIKGDFNENHLKTISFPQSGGLKWRIKEFLYKGIDVLSSETVRSTELIQKGLLGSHLRHKTIYMPNAFDTDLCRQKGIVRIPFEQKENMIITVGRIGSDQKNNRMMLRVLDGVDMRNWKFVFIGPIENDFNKDFEEFIVSNPDKKERVLLIGSVDNKEMLFGYYNRAKVFISTSTFEGFANVFVEALYFGNYILSTKVGGTYEVSNQEKIGKLIDITDESTFKKHLTDIIEGKIDIEVNCAKACDFADDRFVWTKAITSVAQRIKEVYDAKNS